MALAQDEEAAAEGGDAAAASEGDAAAAGEGEAAGEEVAAEEEEVEVPWSDEPGGTARGDW